MIHYIFILTRFDSRMQSIKLFRVFILFMGALKFTNSTINYKNNDIFLEISNFLIVIKILLLTQ